MCAAVSTRSIITYSLGKGGNIDLSALPHSCCPDWDTHHQIHHFVILRSLPSPVDYTPNYEYVTFPPASERYTKQPIVSTCKRAAPARHCVGRLLYTEHMSTAINFIL